MPDFSVTVQRVLTLQGTYTITAADEDAANTAAENINKLLLHGYVSWEVIQDTKYDNLIPKDIDWQEEEDEMDIEDITEE
jgi:hypothetical protein